MKADRTHKMNTPNEHTDNEIGAEAERSNPL